MDCLICSKLFNMEFDYKCGPLPDPELCSNSFIKLFKITELNQDEVHRVFDDPTSTLLCSGCHSKLNEVDRAFKMVDIIERALLLAKEVIRNNLVRSVSKVMTKIPEHEMSAASLGRLAILRAIGGAGNAEHEEALANATTDTDSDETDDFNVSNVEEVVVKKDKVEETPQVQELEAPENVQIDVSPIKIKPPKANGKVKKVVKSKRFKCKVCSKMLPSKRSLNWHEDFYDHADRRHSLNFKCKYCSRRFYSKDQLKKHWGDKTQTECSICEPMVSFPTPGCFMQHNFKVHGKGYYARKSPGAPGTVSRYFTRMKVGGYKCKICSKIVKNRSQHKSYYHSDI